MFETGAFLLNSSGNIDRLVTDDGKEYHLEPTLAIEATNNANAAARLAKETIERLEEDERVRDQNEEARKQAENGRKSVEEERVVSENGRVRADEERAERVNAALDLVGKATTSANDAADRAKASSDAADASARRADDAAAVAKENVLQGTASGGVVHVEDAYPALLRECKVLGKSVQTVTTGKNLLDVKSVTPGKFVNASDGFLVNAETFSASEMIPVAAGQDYTYAGAPTGTGAGYAWYDAEGAFVSGGNFSGISATVTLTSPERATSLRLTVDDKKSGSAQLEKSATATAYEPYSGGKPSPRPDFPQPTTSVGKAEVVTAGKNLISLNERVLTSHGITVTSHTDGTFTLDGTGDSQGLWLNIGKADLVAGQTYTLSLSKKHAALGVSLWSAADNKHVLMVAQGSDSKTTAVEKSERVTVFLAGGAGASYSNDETSVQLEIGSRSGFTPHVPSVSASIDLQGHELCSITENREYNQKTYKDELVVGSDGNVSLIKRVFSARIDGSEPMSLSSTGEFQYFTYAPKTVRPVDDSLAIRSNRFGKIGREPWCFYVAGGSNATLFFTFPLGTFANDGELNEWLAGHPIDVSYLGSEPQIISLGKVPVPALPESTSSVWNNGNIRTDVSATYVRDVNMVIGKLEQSLAAIPVIAAASL